MSRKADPTSWATLQQLLVERYDDLRQRLTRRLGSTDAAQDALQELYLRIHHFKRDDTVTNPMSYLVASAANLARDTWRTEQRRAKLTDIEAFYEIIDEMPGPDRIVEGRQSLAVFARSLQKLTDRQRAILVAVHVEHLSQSEIAARLKISSRLVRLELQRALEHCEGCLAKYL
jgi:RNA polymerase sigma factor (sigma-70 family)